MKFILGNFVTKNKDPERGCFWHPQRLSKSRTSKLPKSTYSMSKCRNLRNFAIF